MESLEGNHSQGIESKPTNGSTKNAPIKSKRRMSRNQRRKLKQQEANQTTNDTGQRIDNRVIIKDNENLVNFYRAQRFFEKEDEFDEYLDYLRKSLPASFRINTFDYEQGKLLRQLIENQFKQYLETGEDVEIANQPETAPAEQKGQDVEAQCMPTLDCLSWYPRKMAWQMNVSRVDFRKSSILRNLHRFIQAETDNGFISRQEAVSMIPPLVLDIQSGQNILDMCAAPGSKTAQLLEYLTFDIHGDEKSTYKTASGEISFKDGLVVANDVDNKRCYMLVHQSSRLNSPNCVIVNEDASKMPTMETFTDGNECTQLRFDRILCDAPCSGDGTIRKNPDVWRKWNTANANNLHGIQSKILKRGVELLNENGLIVYSTCSMNPVEDEAVVANILRLGEGSLVLEDCSSKLDGIKSATGLTKWVVFDGSMRIVNGIDDVRPEQVSQIHKSLFPPSDDEIAKFHLERCIRIFPHQQNTGAFFVALIRKKTSLLPYELAPGPTCDDAGKPIGEPRRYPQPKRRRYGFKEDPYIFLDANDHDWKAIKEFYGLPEHFPVHQLTHKCRSGKKRSIYLVSKQTRDFILANQELPDRRNFIKVVNGGMRLFMKAQTESGFRICQDGINEVLPYISPDLIVPVTEKDLLELLARRTVPFSDLSFPERIAEKLRVGSCVLMYKHSFANQESDKESVKSERVLEMPLVAWRGERSLALYVSNTYKLHLRSLIQGKIVGDDTAVTDNAESPRDAQEVKNDNGEDSDAGGDGNDNENKPVVETIE